MNKKMQFLGLIVVIIMFLNLAIPVSSLASNTCKYKVQENEILEDISLGKLENSKYKEVTKNIEKAKIYDNDKQVEDTILEESIISEGTIFSNKNASFLASNAAKVADSDVEFNKSGSTIGYLNKDGKNYIYTRANGSNFIRINRYCIETKENKTVFSSYGKFNIFYVKDTYIQDNVLYTAFMESETSNDIRVVGFNLQTEELSFDKKFAIKLSPYYTHLSIGVDRKQNVYFAKALEVDSSNRYEKFEITSFDKNGNKLDSFSKNVSYTITQMDFSASSKDSSAMFLKLYTFAGYSNWWDDYVIRTNNGRFSKKDAYRIRQYGGMELSFLDSAGKYAYDQYGEVLEFNYNDAEDPSGISFIVRQAIKYNGNNIRSQGIYTSDSNYIYLGSTNGVLYVVNWKNFNIERSLDLGSNVRITGLHKSGNSIFIEYTNSADSKQYIKTVDTSAFGVVKKNIKITTHTALKHSEDDIRKKYNDSAIKHTGRDIYDVAPSITTPYKEGTLKSQVKTDTLNQINYFRYLAGVNSISINNTYMDYAGKGAVIMAANDELSHFPSKPSGMADTFYTQGKGATSGSIATSGNISWNSLMAYSIKGYVDDTNNVEPNVGHRLSMIDPRAKSTCFGFAGAYGVVDIFSDYNYNPVDAFYSWPSPGNFPTESINSNAKWHIQLPNDNYHVDGTINIVLKANGKIYSFFNEDFDLYYDSYYEAYFFDIPTELKNYLTGNGYSFESGKKVDVEIHNIADNSGNTYIISYPINFFSVKEDYKLGDVNFDKKVNLIDYTKILAHVKQTSLLTGKSLKAADVNKDTKVNLIDYTKVLAHVKQTALLW